MILRWFPNIVLGMVLFITTACALSNAGSDDDLPKTAPTANIPKEETFQAGYEILNFGDNAQWPAFIPEDIPVFEGKITRVFETGDRIRIIYEDISLDYLKEYLRLLEKQGFHLEYIVYVEEGFPDNSEARMKKGDYDAVDITRGEYHMNIGYGEGVIGYDIDTAGFADKIPAPSGLPWPADLVNVVPQPERCLVDSIFPVPPSGYQINCRTADGEVVSDYTRALQAAGYQGEAPGGATSYSVYARDDLGVAVQQRSAVLVWIEITPLDRSNTTWPPDLTGKVPAPEGCPVKNVLSTGDMKYLISCDAESEQAIAGYVDWLVGAGFAETRRMETQEGKLVSVTFSKGNLNMHLMISLPLGLMIDVSED